MKIFLEERTIEFIGNKQADSSADILVFEYQPGKQIKEVWKEFEADKTKKKLLIWSQDENADAMSAFYSLFRIIVAAGGIVRNEKGEILFIFRYGKWDLPKGKLVMHHEPQSTFKEYNGFKINENPVEAAVREVMEETGLRDIKVIHELASTYHIFYKTKKRLIKRTYWFEMFAGSGQTLIPQEKEGITIVKWISEKEIPGILNNTFASLNDLILSVLAEN